MSAQCSPCCACPWSEAEVRGEGSMPCRSSGWCEPLGRRRSSCSGDAALAADMPSSGLALSRIRHRSGDGCERHRSVGGRATRPTVCRLTGASAAGILLSQWVSSIVERPRCPQASSCLWWRVYWRPVSYCACRASTRAPIPATPSCPDRRRPCRTEAHLDGWATDGLTDGVGRCIAVALSAGHVALPWHERASKPSQAYPPQFISPAQHLRTPAVTEAGVPVMAHVDWCTPLRCRLSGFAPLSSMCEHRQRRPVGCTMPRRLRGIAGPLRPRTGGQQPDRYCPVRTNSA